MADFKRRCPTVENGTNLMTPPINDLLSAGCCVLYQSTTEVLCFTEHINNSITMVTVINVCYQFSETVCSHVPIGAHLPFPSFSFKATVLHSGAGGPYFHVDVTSVQLPPLDTHNQIWKASMGSSEMLCAVVWVGLCSTEQPSLKSKR